MTWYARIMRALYLTRQSPSEWLRATYAPWRIFERVLALFGGYSVVLGMANSEQSKLLSTTTDALLPIIFYILLSQALVTATMFLREVVAKFKETAPALIPEPRELSFNSTNLYCQMIGEQQRCGGAVELMRGPFLDRNLADNVWDTSDVEIIINPGFVSIPDWPGLVVGSDADNGIKYSLQNFDMPLKDRYKRCTLYVKRTDYNSQIPVSQYLRGDQEKRHFLFRGNHQLPAGVNPLVPSALCLHVVCMLRDGSVLSLRRRKTDYFNSTVSFSFEEQISPADESSQNGVAKIDLRRTLLRALGEEVFPLRECVNGRIPNVHAEQIMQRIDGYVSSRRIWSLLHEEMIGGHALFAVCKLNLSESELESVSKALILELRDRKDNEGDHYIFSPDDVEVLGRGDVASCKLLFSEERIRVCAFDLSNNTEESQLKLAKMASENIYPLHPTSLYRAVLLNGCIN